MLSDRTGEHHAPQPGWRLNAPFGAQCFPTDSRDGIVLKELQGLNAPFGAQCFPTNSIRNLWRKFSVSMHLLVLSAFRLKRYIVRIFFIDVSMHLLVLSAFRLSSPMKPVSILRLVSMHLLVLSAFRLATRTDFQRWISPSQCTFWCSVLSDTISAALDAQRFSCLNAPFGAQCFPTLAVPDDVAQAFEVSMHLLVLSAFRQKGEVKWTSRKQCLNAPFGAQCFPTEFIRHPRSKPLLRLNAPFGAQCFPTVLGTSDVATVFRSQCTFWCSVLSDTVRRSSETTKQSVSMHLLVLSAFRLSN